MRSVPDLKCHNGNQLILVCVEYGYYSDVYISEKKQINSANKVSLVVVISRLKYVTMEL